MSYFEQISVIKGYIDSDNSTTTPLGADGVFTGSWVNILDVGTLGVTVYSDKASADDGLELQFSTDGVNIDSCAFYNIPAANGKYFSNQAEAQYFRIKYTNGSVAQTEFRNRNILDSIRTRKQYTQGRRREDGARSRGMG